MNHLSPRLVGLEIERCGVHAVSLPCRLRAVREQMPQMRVTTGAQDLDPLHSMGRVRFRCDIFVVYRHEKAGPSGARFEFSLRAKQFSAAGGTAVQTILVIVPILARERAFGAFLTGYIVLFWGEAGSPFGVGFLYLVHT